MLNITENSAVPAQTPPFSRRAGTALFSVAYLFDYGGERVKSGFTVCTESNYCSFHISLSSLSKAFLAITFLLLVFF